MDAQDILHASLSKLVEALSSGETSSLVITDTFLTAAEAHNPAVNAITHLSPDSLRKAAIAADERRASGKPLSPFDGIPVGIKDVIAVDGEPLTCSSRMLQSFIAPYNATVTNRLLKAGWLPFGRLNMDEFAMGSSTENSAFVKTANPWNLQRIPGGSSGGSAAAVAARLCPVALGSDTGGSIRQPAAFCGVVGLKPTYGSVSRFGLVAFASSLDQIGPMANSVADAAALFDAISGHDPLDSTSFSGPLKPSLPATTNPRPPERIGIPREYFGEGLADSVRKAVDEAVEVYRQLGSTIVDISLPHTEFAVPTYYIVATAEASSNLSRYDGVRYGHRSSKADSAIDLNFLSRGEGFGPEVKRRIVLGTYVLSSGYYDAYYKRAQQVRHLIRDDFISAFNNVDAILTPTTPTPAFAFDEKTSDPLEMYLADIFTISVNLAGLPAVSLPCGLSPDGLPIGFQLIGKPFQEPDLLSCAAAYEAAAPFTHRPDLIASTTA